MFHILYTGCAEIKKNNSCAKGLSCEGTRGNECEVYVSWVNFKEAGGGKNDMYKFQVSCDEL